MDRRKFLYAGGLAGSLVTLGLSGCTRHPSGVLRYASPAPVWWNAAPFFAASQNFYANHGISVASFDVATGVRSKEAVYVGNAQSGVASPNSFTAASVDQLSELRILCNTMTSRRTVSMAANTAIDQIDWRNARIGIVPQTISEFYLISYLRREGLLDELYPQSLNLVRSSPVGVANAFRAGEVDVAVVWEPLASLIRDEAGVPERALQDPELYEQQIYLLTSVAAYEQQTELLESMRAAFRDACNYIEGNRSEAGAYLESLFDYPSGSLRESAVWNGTSFAYSDDPNTIWPTLVADFELASLSGVAQAPNVQALEQVLEYIT